MTQSGRPESSYFSMFWMPDRVRHDEFGLITISSNFIFKNFDLSKAPNYQSVKVIFTGSAFRVQRYKVAKALNGES
jgi:hypothetical protein